MVHLVLHCTDKAQLGRMAVCNYTFGDLLFEFFYLCTGVLAYLGFGGYLGLGETLWSQPLNYYLIPVIVSLSYIVRENCYSKGICLLTPQPPMSINHFFPF